MYTCGRITFFIRRSFVFYSFISHFHSCEFGAKNLRNEAKGFLQKYPVQGLAHYFLFNLIFLTSSVNINLPMYIFSLKDWWKYQFSICQKFEHFALYWAKIFELACNSSSYPHLPYLWGWIKRKLNTLNWTEYLLLLCFLACMCYLAPPAHSLRSTPPVGWSLFRRKSLLLGALFCSPPFVIYFYCVARLKCALQIFYACQLPSEEVEISPFSGVGGWVGGKYVYLTHIPVSQLRSTCKSFPLPASLIVCI